MRAIESLFKETENSIVQFLEKLHYNAVLVPLRSIISALDNSKEVVETAAALPEFWNNVPEFEKYALLQAVESCVSGHC